VAFTTKAALLGRRNTIRTGYYTLRSERHSPGIVCSVGERSVVGGMRGKASFNLKWTEFVYGRNGEFGDDS
jgi:hypothetical protein